MITKQFQDEEGAATLRASSTHLSRTATIRAERGWGKQTSYPAIESMLLGIRLRGWLADSEKKFLDNLAPDRSITFLILRDRYLHPEGVELFPYSLIETAVQEGGQAIFTHRYQPRSHDTSDRYTIYTAVIDPYQPKPLVLGFFGPDYQLGVNEIEHQFSRVVSLFRETYYRHKDFTHKLGRRLESETPTIIVNRCSGRVVSLNEGAATLFDNNPRNLIDLEFGQLKSQFLSILPGHKLQMTNINEGDLYLTVITVLSRHTCGEDESFDVPVYSLQRIHDKLNDIIKAAKSLEKLSLEAMPRDATDLSHQVVVAAGELQSYITELHHLPTDQWK